MIQLNLAIVLYKHPSLPLKVHHGFYTTDRYLSNIEIEGLKKIRSIKVQWNTQKGR